MVLVVQVLVFLTWSQVIISYKLDSNNFCIPYENIFLPNPEPVNLSFSVSDINSDGESNDYNGYSVSCNGGNDGTIGIFISGGSGSYILL